MAELTNQVREAVLGWAVSGKKRLTEQRLVTRFGVSRTPIREALGELEAEGLIERRQKRGITLRTPSVQEISEIYDLRGALEGFAGRLAAQCITSQGAAELRKAFRRLQSAEQSNDAKKRTSLDRAFHSTIIRISGNRTLMQMMDRFAVLVRVFTSTRKLDPTRRRQTRRTPFTHEEIVEAICTGRAEDAERLLRGHMEWAKRNLLEQAMGVRFDDSHELSPATSS